MCVCMHVHVCASTGKFMSVMCVFVCVCVIDGRSKKVSFDVSFDVIDL